jgi:hypothetical protein
MVKLLFPDDVKLLEKIQEIHETSLMSKTIFRSTSHVCNGTLKKSSDKTINELSKYKTNMSFKSSNNVLGNSKKMNHTRGFSTTSFFDFNQLNRTSYAKPKLEPLSGKNLNKGCKDFIEGDQDELFKNKLENSKNNTNNNNNNNNNNKYNNNLISEKENDLNDNDYDYHFDNNYDNYNKEFNNFNNSKNINFDFSNKNHSITKIDSRNNFNYYGTRTSFNNTKKDKQFLILKTAEQLTGANVNKSLGNSQMPIISNYLNLISTKNKFENKLKSNNNFNSNNKGYNLNPVFDQKVKKKNIEKDIEKKIERYRIKLSSDMLNVLKEEKQREEEREMHYNKATSEMEKRRLESLIALERVQSSERIIRLNE